MRQGRLGDWESGLKPELRAESGETRTRLHRFAKHCAQGLGDLGAGSVGRRLQAAKGRFQGEKVVFLLNQPLSGLGFAVSWLGLGVS
jgi:hypothetical protein